ncbi:hypothetical protein ABFB09_04270 [Dehalogenimonas sp. THU2]|uniref:hypothetical protein n=1 Tax=Dehalogenimonas sp. THU2 TaxID=3151121 RepID=UPI00321869DE
MASRVDTIKRSRFNEAVASAPETDENGLSLLIGGLVVFGLALGGLVIGYVSPTIEWASTAVLVSTGTVLTGSGIWNLVKEHLP